MTWKWDTTATSWYGSENTLKGAVPGENAADPWGDVWDSAAVPWRAPAAPRRAYSSAPPQRPSDASTPVEEPWEAAPRELWHTLPSNPWNTADMTWDDDPEPYYHHPAVAAPSYQSYRDTDFDPQSTHVLSARRLYAATFDDESEVDPVWDGAVPLAAVITPRRSDADADIADPLPVMTKRGMRTKPWWPYVVATILVIVGGLAGVGVWNVMSWQQHRDMSGSIVVADPDSLPLTADEVRQVDGVDTTPDQKRFEVPAVGLDVPLGLMNTTVTGYIKPPGFTSAYVVRDLGTGLTDPTAGTTYVAMHALAKGTGPGNALIDVPDQSVAVKAGDEITVGTWTYVVTQTAVIPKPELGNDPGLWDGTVPGRLVVITCMANPAYASAKDNVVIIATLKP